MALASEPVRERLSKLNNSALKTEQLSTQNSTTQRSKLNNSALTTEQAPFFLWALRSNALGS
jgi:hypothetical protein